MKILYDYRIFDDQIFGGISNSFVQLISHLPADVDYEIAVAESNNVHLRNSGLMDIPPLLDPPEHFILHRKKSLKYQRSLYKRFSRIFPSKTSLGRNMLCSINALKRGDFDVFHPTYFYDYFLPYLNGKPFVLTVHDMVAERYFRRNDFQVVKKRKLVEQAAHIITVSRHTKDDLMAMLHVPEERITVIYHGAPKPIVCDDEAPLVEGPYLLFVGHRISYKNFRPMVRSLVPVLQRHPGLRLVCTGHPFRPDEEKFLQSLGITDRIIQMRPDDHGLANLYRHAVCFLFPSLYEGFGIPILEAWQANCPVLLNTASCFPEVAGDAAVFFHLNDTTDDLEDVVEDFFTWTPEKRQQLIARQQQRLTCYDWQASANQLADVYRKVAEEHRCK